MNITQKYLFPPLVLLYGNVLDLIHQLNLPVEGFFIGLDIEDVDNPNVYQVLDVSDVESTLVTHVQEAISMVNVPFKLDGDKLIIIYNLGRYAKAKEMLCKSAYSKMYTPKEINLLKLQAPNAYAIIHGVVSRTPEREQMMAERYGISVDMLGDELEEKVKFEDEIYGYIHSGDNILQAYTSMLEKANGPSEDSQDPEGLDIGEN